MILLFSPIFGELAECIGKILKDFNGYKLYHRFVGIGSGYGKNDKKTSELRTRRSTQ